MGVQWGSAGNVTERGGGLSLLTLRSRASRQLLSAVRIMA